MTTLVKEKNQTTIGYRVPHWHPTTLPKSLYDAAGLLKGKYADLKKHYRKIREEWPSYVKE